MSNDEVTTVAADFMYLVILGDQDIIEEIVNAMNEEAHKKNTNKIYVSGDIDIQVDYLPETSEFQKILVSNVQKRRAELLEQALLENDSDALLSEIDLDETTVIVSDEASDIVSDIVSDGVYDLCSEISEEYNPNKKYFVMGEGVETAQCYTCGEGYVNAHMLIEIEERDENFNILFPVLNLDDEVNPEELITSWVVGNNISHVADNLSTRLVNMVGTEHDILVFAAYVNRSLSMRD
jgi:hypothetical protein